MVPFYISSNRLKQTIGKALFKINNSIVLQKISNSDYKNGFKQGS